MYGYCISKKGILTNNYYKVNGWDQDPEPQGAYIMIRKKENEIRLNQDFYGSQGLYLYENKETSYFALSNSFLLLEEYLVGKHNITFNKEFADNFIISGLCSPSIHETLINEIIRLPSNSFIIINIKTKKLNIFSIDYQENSIPFESKEGIEILDKWVDKWGYIFRSLKKQTDNISFDLSGGFDTRITLSILLNSGIDINDILINSINDKRHNHDEDFKIAKDISSKFRFKLNNFELDNNGTILSLKDRLSISLYIKLGFHKEFHFIKKFYSIPRFLFTGSGGELIRGFPGNPIKNYIKSISSFGKNILGYKEEFFKSSLNLLKRSIDLLLNQKTYNNDYEITSALYSKGRTRNHFGKFAFGCFIANIYELQPIIDPDLKKLKYQINNNSSHDLIAFIYQRFSPSLINFPFEGNRTLNFESIKKAKKLNGIIPPYKTKIDYNPNFFIDNKRKSPVPFFNVDTNPQEYLKELFDSYDFINIIKTIYNISVYNFAKEYSKESNYYPLRHMYGLLAIAKVIDDLKFNGKKLKIKNKCSNISID